MNLLRRIFEPRALAPTVKRVPLHPDRLPMCSVHVHAVPASADWKGLDIDAARALDRTGQTIQVTSPDQMDVVRAIADERGWGYSEFAPLYGYPRVTFREFVEDPKVGTR